MDNAIISAYIQSGPFGKTIILSLLFLSIYIWTIIQNKYFVLRDIRRKNKLFIKEYSELKANIFADIKHKARFKNLPIFELFSSTKNELLLICDEERGIDLADIEYISICASMIIAKTKIDLEKGIVQLATATTIAPFLGLLGTVWGVMNAFIGMGEMGNASIAAVAPGLSEALVTTAIGLLVAIPSAIAFNYTKTKVSEEITNLNNFAMDLIGNIEKQFVTRQDSK